MAGKKGVKRGPNTGTRAHRATRNPGEPLKDKRRELFCHEYLACKFNATTAAKNAGYSKDSANNNACKILAIPEVQERLNELLSPRMRKLELTSERILEELGHCGFARFTDAIKITEDGSLAVKPLDEMDESTKAAIAGISINTSEFMGVKRTTTKVFFHDKVKSLELLGKNKRLFDSDENKKRGVTFSMSFEGLGDERDP